MTTAYLSPIIETVFTWGRAADLRTGGLAPAVEVSLFPLDAKEGARKEFEASSVTTTAAGSIPGAKTLSRAAAVTTTRSGATEQSASSEALVRVAVSKFLSGASPPVTTGNEPRDGPRTKKSRRGT